MPVSYNDASRDRNFISIVDLYGYDSYPQMFDCSNPYRWNAIPSDYRAYHQSANPSEPWYIPEFQGGSYDPYEGPGYDACGILTNANFARVANQALWAQSVTMLSIYMGFGGTNWGGLAEP